MKRFVFTLLTLCLFTAVAFAQTSNTGSIVGTISGPDGVIPGATITVTDNLTKSERTIVSSGDGAFTVSQLQVGLYTVKISAQGFKTHTATELKVDAGGEFALNVTLEVGNISENVTVVAGADVVNSTTGELSTTISPREVKDLPINGRNPLNLLNLLPGVNATSNSINGQRSSSVNYTRDGLNVQDNFIRNGFVQDQPTVDDTGEFTVVTQNAGPESGSGSTQVQLVTPRGGADFHGALFEFNRNSYFGANRFFNNLTNVARPFLNRNQFGGTLSGPAVLPNFGEGGPSLARGKAFFFMSYEGFRLAQQASISTLTTLLPAARNGTFTYIDTGGVQRTVNVLTGAGLNLSTPANVTAFNSSGGVLPVDPIIQARVLNNLPTAGNGTLTGINLLQQVQLNRSDPETRNAVAGRFDFQPSDKHTFNFVYKKGDISDARTDLAAGFSTGVLVTQGGPTKLYVGAYQMAPTPSFTNEVRGGYQRSEPFFFESGVPTNYLIGIPLVTTPEGSFRDQGRNTDYYNLQDNASYSRGNHSIRFGGMYQAYRIEAVNFAGTTPTFTISGTANPNAPRLATALFPGGINATDRTRADQLRYLLAGIVGSGSLTANVQSQTSGFVPGSPAVRLLNFENYSAYVGDQWRVRPNLTVNLGLRYELYTPLKDPRGLYLEPKVTNFADPVQDLLNPNGVYQFVGGNAGDPGAFFKADKNNFGPSVSFAWTPEFGDGFIGGLAPGGGKTVIRGGYRMNYVNDEYVRSPDNALLNNTGLGSVAITALNTSVTPATGNLRSQFTPTPGFNPLPGFTIPAVASFPRAYALNNGANVFFFGTVSLIDPNLQVQKTHEYNIGIQREFGQNAFEIRYVGGRSNELTRSIDYNQIEIRKNGFLTDFLKAQNNCRLQGATLPGAAAPLAKCTDARFNAAIPGSVPLPVFALLPGAGFLNDPAVVPLIQQGLPPDLVLLYIQNGIAAGVPFLANPNTGVANYTTNGGEYNYNALQAELRRRFSKGLSFAVNYTFQKILADVVDDGQTRVNPFLDNENKKLDYARPDYDRTHTINANMIYELPFGRGKRWLSDSGAADRVFGGLQFSSIVNFSSGVPIGILDPRGTLNRTGRSGRQSANSHLNSNEIKKLFGVFRTPNGIFVINPSVLTATASNAAGTQLTVDLTQPLPTGFTINSIRAVAPINSTPFANQVFSYALAGTAGNLPRNFINGPIYLNWDAGLAKRIKFTETTSLQLRMEVFNVLNRANFSVGDQNINSTSFGRITATNAPRVMQFGARFEF
ncbi:MAG: TonB-dependent receptor [Pyrinomonadaceae bacterium]|nr:TonB-dependent receptor [Pyrinomonadaceae bacterium]